MDIGTERYLEGQKKKRAINLGFQNEIIYPCERCASTLVLDWSRSNKYFKGRGSQQDTWEKEVTRGKGVDSRSVQYFAWGLDRPIVVCKECSDQIEDWPDKKVTAEIENWPIEVER